MSNHVDRDRLGEAVREWIERSREVGHELTAIVIMHEGTQDPVDTIPANRIPKPPRGDEPTEKVDDLIELIAKKMEGDAKGWNGTYQQYFVEPHANASHRPFARLAFGLQIETTKGRGRTERADDQGERAMFMRLLDTTFTKALDRHDKIETRSDVRLEQAYRREELLRNENMALRAQVDEMLTAKEEREANARERAEKATMMRELFQDLKTWGPVILNRMADKNLVPEGELAPEQRLIRELVRQLDGPEVSLMIETLAAQKPRIGLMLAELVVKVQDEDIRRSSVHEAAQKIIADSKEKIGALNGTTPKRLDA